MQLQYSITWEQYLTQDVVDEMVRRAARRMSATVTSISVVWLEKLLRANS